ncbi:MAG TPA: FliM/FliN family flagellar motor C-terminal domain-containing protein [Terriglobales bacterium]|nr:FliM/FliN family flagellar motor C-terminal domain-containing protein [Terriglobales bacterium]
MAAAVQLKDETAIRDESWRRVEVLPSLISVEIPVPSFTVADLLRIAPGHLINTGWTVGVDVPLRVNGQLIAWSEFEIVNNHIAVRLTELA